MNRAAITVEIIEWPQNSKVSLVGRLAWAMCQLHRAGTAGCTPIDTPGPRWSGYVHKLRRRGIDIETRQERHGGPFPGRHARYVLRSRVRIVEPGFGGGE